MRILNRLTGGYKRVMDRLLDLQDETFTIGNAPFANLGVDLVLSGCAVTDNGNGTVSIANGLVYIGGNTLRFDGASNIISSGIKAMVAGPVVTSGSRQFGDGSTKNIYSEQRAIIADQDPSNHTQIKIRPKLYDVKQFIQDQIYNSETIGTIKHIYDLDGHFLDNFDVTGLGVTPRWNGWALDNGNNDTPGSAGMVIVGAGKYTDPISGQQTIYAGDGSDTGGEIMHKLIKSEMPKNEIDMGKDTKHDDGGPAGVQVLSAQTPGDGPNSNGHVTINFGGNDQPHNNMQPYRGAYRVVKVR